MKRVNAEEARAKFEAARAAVDAAMARARVDRSQENLGELTRRLGVLQAANAALLQALEEELTRQ